ncbi:trypsin-like cysteine/serine peptidase domain-containing protein [Cokeromyces recurvatus]|uniref:trypsin-like cysteine/serine peptidase domain-containing protein n=1 Tax=Cokeromyces recurvatus TaxID=90255 RepID=UPI00221F81D7|nr:trypsin-like cysteine/serine peptidase domain-containing protein [Cokeromyces recurvatus]KAI7902586.1 trypsin-like cysteine/serine peptidase domain-containing protein [Cokeromyces recurvatus]
MIGNPHLCGGTLISYDPAYVFTAAHCLLDATEDITNYFAVVDNKTIAIADYIIHPYYNRSVENELVFDAAIIRLASPLVRSSTISHATFWSSQMVLSKATTQAELIGLGYMDVDGHTASTLQRLPLKLTAMVNMTIETENRLGAMACHGDSGGPLIISDQSNNKSLVAGGLVRIFGVYDAVPHQPTCPIRVGKGLQR